MTSNRMTVLAVLGSFLLTLSGACGSSSDGATSSEFSTGGTSGASGTGGSSAGSGNGGAGGASGNNGAIDPIVVGNAWTYDVTEIGTFPLCPSGSFTGTVLSQGLQDGMADAFAVQSLCQNAGVVYYTVDGDIVHSDVQGMWVLSLDAPVEEGHTWTDGTDMFVWHDMGSVTVPAGTFSQCFSVTVDGSESFTIFCRGAGPVHWHRVDSGNGYDAVLTSKNF